MLKKLFGIKNDTSLINQSDLSKSELEDAKVILNLGEYEASVKDNTEIDTLLQSLEKMRGGVPVIGGIGAYEFSINLTFSSDISVTVSLYDETKIVCISIIGVEKKRIYRHLVSKKCVTSLLRLREEHQKIHKKKICNRINKKDYREESYSPLNYDSKLKNTKLLHFTSFETNDIEAEIKTHYTNKETYDILKYDFEREIQGVYHNNKILQINEKYNERTLCKNVPIKEEWLEEKKLFAFKESSEGSLRIGGKLPDRFEVPQYNAFKTPIQYIGSLNCMNDSFEWMGLECLHLIYPIDECSDEIFFDYSDPLKPTVFSVGYHSTAWHKGIGYVLPLEFEKKYYNPTYNLSEIEAAAISHEIVGGVPIWFQGTIIPRCPKTDEVMKFVCMLPSNRKHAVINPEAYQKTPSEEHRLHFSFDGHLYVFYSPKSKLAYYRVAGS